MKRQAREREGERELLGAKKVAKRVARDFREKFLSQQGECRD